MIISWLDEAEAMRDQLLDDLAELNLQAAIDCGDRIMETTRMLINYPEIAPKVLADGTRKLVVTNTPFVVFYRFKPRAKRIEITAVFHGRQKRPR